MLRIMCKRQHDNTYSKNLTGYKSTAQSKRERDDQALPGAFQNDRIKPSTFLFGFLFVSHTWRAMSEQPGHEACSHPCSSVSQWDTEDPRSSWVAQGAAESCTKLPCTPVSWARSFTTAEGPSGPTVWPLGCTGASEDVLLFFIICQCLHFTGRLGKLKAQQWLCKYKTSSWEAPRHEMELPHSYPRDHRC